MKQLVQNLRDGKTRIIDVPAPPPRPGMVQVQNAASLVSAGTERMVVDFARKNLLDKARSRPDLVRQMVEKARREGIMPTISAAFKRLDQPVLLGYSSAGTVLEVGEGVTQFQVGDRVACAGGNYASHAEIVVVPTNLLARLDDSTDFESAAFTTLGAIALHGFRLGQPQLGERVAVIGLGLLGLLAIQIANAAGCETFGIDIDPHRVELAKKMGFPSVTRDKAEDEANSFTKGMGFDIVLICADSHSSDPVNLAGEIAADRGHVIAVGASELSIPRKVYYNKELHFQVSRSYGPGRYDPEYEEKGRDYPQGYVRWTEGRNLQAFADLLKQKKVDIKPLVTHRFPIQEADKAYDLITGKIKEPFLGVLITYPEIQVSPQYSVQLTPSSSSQKTVRLGILGAGNYANAVFLPIIKETGQVETVAIASASGVSAQNAAQKFGYQRACSIEQEILEDKDINTIVILTQHNHHARQVIQALNSGKNVYCEKPLSIRPNEMVEIEAALQASSACLMVGFNRRFAPQAVALKNFFAGRTEPLMAHYRINAGYIPPEHWLHDPDRGGGRILGEGCHFIDFLTFLVGGPPVEVSGMQMPDADKYHQDNVILNFKFSDGSIGSLSYLANGNRNLSKEYLEVFCNGKVGILDDFRHLELISQSRRQVIKSPFGQDKGHAKSWSAFLEAVRKGTPPPIPYHHLIGVAYATFASLDCLASGKLIRISSNQR